MNYNTIAEMFLNTVSNHGNKELFYYKKEMTGLPLMARQYYTL